ncbi:Alpha-glucosidase [Exophiala dermatitidis]|uniref:Alpha-glucosidase n=1 Tax=Exophiala dermatitidis (strain ATCC 34100 / CBS 525.76 / NIH/UT8656) TaxID=858893 RepID=H6BP68_EXODN|nr:alpha-glucosidase [Exophiala dermatitidis NIH/UT8656]EHY53295.1 alpha-glucosidase [Exophiala dermatitidis NIH/UT8656]
MAVSGNEADTKMTSCSLFPWWKEATIYQVYPASFKDSNADGWGDIPGIITKLDYLRELGVDVVWLSPIFESPQADMGYDVSDYQKVYARYGTVEDVGRLIEGCHSRGMRLILDLVVNHTSIEHEWFKESRSSKSSSKRDWYIWKPARFDEGGNRKPPTNWRSYFAGSTWTWDETAGEYYLHLYSPDQPDLNWENETCRKAIYDTAMRFWLDRGVDGFRIDTVNKYSKRTDFVDAEVTDPHNEWQPASEMWCNGPRIHEFLQEMNLEVLDHYDAVTVGELAETPDPKAVLEFVDVAAGELNMVFQADIMRLGMGDGFGGKYDIKSWTLPELKTLVERWQQFIEGTRGWTTVFCENHDSGRAVSRFGNDVPEYRTASARLIALWQATLTGTLFLYQGQEIGMTNIPRTWPIDEYKDVESNNFYREAELRGNDDSKEKITAGLQLLARDHSRLPFQWDTSAHAGFTAAEAIPWMKVHDNYHEVNVAKQIDDPSSVLTFYKQMLQLRKQHASVFIHGAFKIVDGKHEKIFSYLKISTDEQQRALVILNFTTAYVPLSEELVTLSAITRMQFLAGSYPEPATESQVLRPYEGRIYVSYQPDTKGV